jgi:hypothetical protein
MSKGSLSDQINLIGALFSIVIPLGVIVTAVIEFQHFYHGSSGSLDSIIGILAVAFVGLVMVIMGIVLAISFYGPFNPRTRRQAIAMFMLGICFSFAAAAGMILVSVRV